MSDYTQGVCRDGAAILKDGQPLTIEQILEALREREVLIEDRARFPDRPDGVGRMIEAHIKNKDAATKSANEYAEMWRRRMDKAERQLAKVEQERDALAAHLDQLGYVLVDAKRSAAVIAFPSNYKASDYQAFAKEVIANIEKLSQQTPATSLACRDLTKQSEALVALYNDCLGHGGDGMVRCAIMLDRSIELREEAEGHQ